MGAFKLGKMTFGSLFKKPETVLYPVVTKPQPMGLKGHIELEASECILCGACERGCPAGAITVDKANRTWANNRLRCVQCGYCITVCPKTCLDMDPNYAPAALEQGVDVYQVPVQEKAAKKTAVKETVSSEKQPKASSEAKATPSKPAADSGVVKAAADEAPATRMRDEQLESLIGLMPEEKADKVRAALGVTID